MFNPANQTHFSLTLDGLRHDLQVLAFNGHEGISRPYRFELELVGERAGLDLETFLHRPAFLAFTPQGQNPMPGQAGIHRQLAERPADPAGGAA